MQQSQHQPKWLDMGELKKLLMLTVPLYIANLMHMGMGVVDTIVAGQAGTGELAAVALGVSVAAPITIAVSMVLSIVGPIVSRYRGAGYESKVGLLLNNARYAAAVLLVVMLLALYLASFAFSVVTDDVLLAEKARQYVYYIMLGTPAVLLMRIAQGNFEGFGQTRPAMVISLLGVLVNIPLDFVFVFGWGAFPALGGPGCGLATALIQWLMCLGMYVLLFCSRHRIRTRQMWTMRGMEGSLVKAIFRLGIPLGVASLCEMTFFSAVVLVIAPLGELMVSAQQVAINVSGVIFMLPLSLGIAGSIRASYHLGAGNAGAFDAMVRTLLVLALVLVSLFMLLTLLFRQEIVALYTESAPVIATATVLLFYCAVYQIPDALQVIMSGLLRGCHDTTIITWVSLGSYWLVGFPLSCILIRTDWIVPAMGPAGAWISFIVALSIAAVFFTMRFLRTRRRIFSSEH